MCENENVSLPSEIEDGMLNSIKELVRLPAKSRERYEVTFNKYQNWCKKMGTEEKEITNEKVLISYFNNLISKDNKPPTLWSNYSMIKSMIAVNKSVDISKHSNLLLLLKRKSAGYKPRKSKTFERQDISTFLTEANDDEFLLTKVAFIIGLSGACKKKELTDMTTDNVRDKGDYFHFFLQSAKMKVSRDFVVTAGNIKGVNLVDLIRKYINLRPYVDHNRFFVQYSNGMCTRHPVGINTLGGVSRKIAKHLKLKNPDQYTGHCLRRSCTLLLSGAGADISTIKRHGGWKSSLEAERYFSSVENKQRLAAKILGKSESIQDEKPFSWRDEAGVVHISFKPSSSTYQADKEMIMEPIQYTIEQSIAKLR